MTSSPAKSSAEIISLIPFETQNVVGFLLWYINTYLVEAETGKKVPKDIDKRVVQYWLKLRGVGSEHSEECTIKGQWWTCPKCTVDPHLKSAQNLVSLMRGLKQNKSVTTAKPKRKHTRK